MGKCVVHKIPAPNGGGVVWRKIGAAPMTLQGDKTGSSASLSYGQRPDLSVTGAHVILVKLAGTISVKGRESSGRVAGGTVCLRDTNNPIEHIQTPNESDPNTYSKPFHASEIFLTDGIHSNVSLPQVYLYASAGAFVKIEVTYELWAGVISVE